MTLKAIPKSDGLGPETVARLAVCETLRCRYAQPAGRRWVER